MRLGVDRTTLLSKLGGNVQKQDLPDFSEVLKMQTPESKITQAPLLQEPEIPVEPMSPRRNRPPRRVDRAAGMSLLVTVLAGFLGVESIFIPSH